MISQDVYDDSKIGNRYTQFQADIQDLKFKNGTSLSSFGCVVSSIASCLCMERGLYHLTRYRKHLSDLINNHTNKDGDYVKPRDNFVLDDIVYFCERYNYDYNDIISVLENVKCKGVRIYGYSKYFKSTHSVGVNRLFYGSLLLNDVGRNVKTICRDYGLDTEKLLPYLKNEIELKHINNPSYFEVYYRT